MIQKKDGELFAQILGKAVHYIAATENKSIKIIQDELGYSLGRGGGSAIDYWRRGHIPENSQEVERLAHMLVERKGISTPDDLCQFLTCANFPRIAALCQQLFPTNDIPYRRLSTMEDANHISPFIVGPPIQCPHKFFGRDTQLKRIFGLVSHFPLQHIAIIGPRRSGKTSLLHYLRMITTTAPARLRPGQKNGWLRQPDAYRWVYVDFQDARMHNQETLLRHILTGLELPVPEVCNLTNFLSTVSQHLVLPSIILIDELERAFRARGLEQDVLWESLRSLASNSTDGRLGLIAASKEFPQGLQNQVSLNSSPFLNIFGHTVQLGAFTEDEARSLINSSPKPFSPEDIDWIMAQSKGWPILLQALCLTRLNTLDESGDAWKDEALLQILPYHPLLKQP
jgi:hypothetical protein